MFNEQLRRAVETAPRDRLPEVMSAVWKAFGANHISEDEAAELQAMREARDMPSQVVPSPAPRARVGSRPRSDASMERRRRWAASGRMPPQVAVRFTLAEQAVLAVISAEVQKRGDCRLYQGHIAAVAGVAVSTVRAALRHACKLGIVTIEERRSSAWRNLSSIVRIIDAGWIAWNRLARRPRGGGTISPVRTNTKDQERGFRGEQGGDHRRQEVPGIHRIGPGRHPLGNCAMG